MCEPTKGDWKKFREKLPRWQERYMETLVKEYAAYLLGEEAASTKFWTLDARIKKDRRLPGVQLAAEKSSMVWDIALLIKDGVIDREDLEDFSGGCRRKFGGF